MYLPFKNFFRRFYPRQPRNHQANRVDDQTHLKDAHRPSPTSPERPLSTDAETSNRLCQEFLDLAKGLQPSFPQGCGWLGPADLQDIEEPPIDGGRFADVWRGRLEDRKVAIKSYRCYVCFDCDRVRLRFWREAHAYNLLSHRNIVPFIGAYSTPKHPFSLVFDFMEHLNLFEYLRKNPGADKLELVTGVARGLHHMHDLGVVHGNLEIINVLVDSEDTPRVAGLGSVRWESSPAAWSEDSHELTRCSAPEMVNPEAFGSPRPHTTKASDVYAFGVLTYQVFAGNRIFHNLNDNAAVYLMLDGSRPPRPDNPELSDRVWDMINRCWKHAPSQRITIADAVSVLEADSRRTR